MVARKTPLRAVGPSDKPPSPAAMTVEQAAKGGTHRDLLLALRERIAKAVADPKCPPRDLAALSRRLQDIAKEIDDIDLRAKEEADEGASTPDEAWDSEAL